MREEPKFVVNEEMIFAKNQNQSFIVNPKKVYGLTERGKFIKVPLKKEALIISTFWEKKQKTIALMMLSSALVLFSILLQESNMANLLFNNAWNTLISLLNYL